MKHVAAIVSTFSLLLGGMACENRDRAADERDKAGESRKEAKEELAEGTKEAKKELAEGKNEAAERLGEAKKEAAEDMREAREHGKEAAEAAAKSDDKQPVAGRDETLRKDIADKLGDDWTVAKEGSAWVATRRNAKEAASGFEKAFDDAKSKLSKDHHSLKATADRGAVRLSGSVDDCEDIDDVMDSYADIDAVHKITADISCPAK